MSPASIVSQYPSADGDLRTIAALLSTANPALHRDDNLYVQPTASIADGAVFIVPMFASSETELPSTADLITHELLWLMVKGKTSAGNAHNLVCEVVGGAKDAGELLAEGQTGVVIAGLTNVFVPHGWLIEIAKIKGMFTIPKPGASAAEPSGEDKAASVVSPSSPASCKDLDGRTHECRDKKNIQARLDKVQVMSRLFSADRMLHYVAELLFNHERFAKTCNSLKARGKTQPDEHRDAGMHRCSCRACPCRRPAGTSPPGSSTG
jgi:hypothetical protein